jgi:transcriptional regulator with XRE-family HTH domain
MLSCKHLLQETHGVEKPLIATRLKTLREKAEMSQQQLATKAGLSISVVAHIEQGKKPDPRMSTVRALAQALGVSSDALMNEEPKQPRRPRKL